MKEEDDKRDFGLVLVLLRAILGWHRALLATRSGIDEGLLADYEQGLRTPFRKNRERLAKAFGVEASFLAELVPACRSLRLAYERARQGGRPATGLADETAARLEETVAGAVLETLQPFLRELAGLDLGPAPRAEHHAWAAEQWTALGPLPAESQGKIGHTLLGDERSWALAVRLCQASQAAAADSAAEALRLARLAMALAKAAPGPQKWRQLLLGFCQLFVGNALRVGGGFAAAREAFARADELWAQGEGGDPAGLLDATRRLDLKASFLKIDGRSEEAVALLDQALQAPQTAHARGRLLLQKAVSLEIGGEYEAALQDLAQAEPLIDTQAEPRLSWVLLFNRGVLDCHLDRYHAAEALLPRVEALAGDRKLDGIRSLWLKGRTCAGLGRREAALAALAEVRQSFDAEKIAYDYALVSVELATLHLEEGRTRLVKELAGEMAWIFKGQQVHQEALAALALFRHAAQAEKARAEWTRRLVKYLYRAQHNPRLRFAG